MKYHWLLSTVILACLACSSQSGSRHVNSRSDDSFWLLGDWQRTNDEGGKSTYESWTQVNDSTYVGMGYTLMSEDTVFKEIMTLVDGKRLEIKGANMGDPVVFQMIASSDSSFAVVNPENEFPVRIDYIKTRLGMKAIISGDGMEIDFEFVPDSRENSPADSF